MGLLDGLAPTVGGLLTKFGQSVTWHTYTESYDPATGTNTLTDTPTVTKAMVEDYPARDAKGGETSGDGIVRGDRKVTVAASAFTPTTENKVTIGGGLYAVLKIDTQYGTDNALMFTCQVRR
jgi:hypothetical protein